MRLKEGARGMLAIFATVATLTCAVLTWSSQGLGQQSPGEASRMVTLKDFAGNWIIMTGQAENGQSLKLKLQLRRGHIVGGVAGGLGGIDLSRLRGRILRGSVMSSGRKMPMSAELSSDKGQLILIVAPPQSEYDVALAWREGYKPTM